MEELSESQIEYRLEHYKEFQHRLRAIQNYARGMRPGDHKMPMECGSCFEMRRRISYRLMLLSQGIGVPGGRFDEPIS